MAFEASPAELGGRTVIDSSEEPIGKIEEVYLDGEDGQVTWGLVGTGPFGMKKRFVPLRAATFHHEKPGKVAVSIEKAVVKHAPRIDAGDELAPEEQQRLFDHYNIGPLPAADGGSPARRYRG